jgi:hypothetical protein
MDKNYKLFAQITHLSEQSRLLHLINNTYISNEKLFIPSTSSWEKKELLEFHKF